MIPTLHGVDHFGFTVPDIAQAEKFLVDILGAQPIFTLSGKQADDDWMQTHIGVHPRTKITDIRFYRLGNGANLEVFEYDAADGQSPQPRNSDVGGHHLALYVDDMDAAVQYLLDNNVEVMGAPVESAESNAGQRWVYFRSPWGMQFELVSYPNGKAYEESAAVKLWHPKFPSS